MKQRYKIFFILHFLFWIFNLTRGVVSGNQLHLIFLEQFIVMSIFYTNYFYLTPRFFKNKNITNVFKGITILILMNAFLLSFLWIYGSGFDPSSIGYFKWFGFILNLTLYFGSVSTTLKLGFDWVNNEELNKKESIALAESAIRHLKANYNFEFMYEILDSMEKKASEKPDSIQPCLLAFSDLLKYTTYQFSSETVGLHNELAVIKKIVYLNNHLTKGPVISITNNIKFSETKIIPLLLLNLIFLLRDQLSHSEFTHQKISIHFTGNKIYINWPLPSMSFDGSKIISLLSPYVTIYIQETITEPTISKNVFLQN